MSPIEVKSAEEWSTTIASEIVPLGVLEVSEGFAACVDRRDIGYSTRVTRVSSAKNSIHRSGDYINSANDGFAIFHVNLSGRIVIEQHGRSTILEGLSATVYTTDSPSRFAMSSDYRCLLFQFPRQTLSITDRQLRQRLVEYIPNDAPLFRILTAMLFATDTDASACEAGGAGSVETALLTVLSGLINWDNTKRRSRDPLHNRLLRIIDNEFTDVDLDVGTLAKRVGVSERLVYKTFASNGEQPAAVIRAKRLERAKNIMLVSDATVTSVAQMSGFGDQSSFTKAFRRDTSHSPAEWRRAQRNAKGKPDQDN